MRDHDIETNHRAEKLRQRVTGEFTGQARCLICPPYAGENAGLRRRSLKRTDRHKDRRKGRDAKRRSQPKSGESFAGLPSV